MNVSVELTPKDTNDTFAPPAAGAITERLLARPPLTVRAAAFISKRRKGEARFRPGRQDKDETSPVVWWFGAIVLTIRLFLFFTRLYKRGNRNALNLHLIEREFAVEGLPEGLEGFRILQLSDLHLPRRFPEFAAKAASLLKGVTVDLCVLNGDYRWGYYGPIDHVPVQLRQILSGVKSHYGVVACLGNHDTLISAEALESAGIPVLFNEGTAIEKGNGTLWACGIDDPHIYKCDSLENALRDAPREAFILLLAHTHEKIREAEQAGVSLYLAGHTHGGQIRLPFIGALFSNASCAREHALGAWQYGKMHGYTTAGLGSTDLPIRFNCPPEAVVITLRKKV
jgi:uncharacterized protein